jgi:hypothetical protein
MEFACSELLVDFNATHESQLRRGKRSGIIDIANWLSANWVGHIMPESFILQDYNP